VSRLARVRQFLRASRPRPQVWQVHISGGDVLFQVAQQEFPVGTRGFEVLAWASEMVSRSSIPEAGRTFDVVLEAEEGFIPVSDVGRSFAPIFLTARP